MYRRFVRTALIVIASSLGWACDSPTGPGMIEPDMFVRGVVDARVTRDAIQLDMTMVIQECEAGETRPCGTDEGLCELGTEQCTENGLWSGNCIGSVEPSDESCDEQDNDCDGLVDEIYRLGQTCKYTDDRGFERTGRVYCDIENGVPYCRPETDCSEDEDGDGVGVCEDCDDTDPQNFPGNVERCDMADNDCDERLDETFDVAVACQIGEGVCRRGGTTVCAMNGMEVVCDGEPGEPADEICDGLDNDCDGNTDEGFQLGAECTVGVGACTRPGVTACDADGAATCMGQPGMPGVETCNEVDDDCDMNVDEGLELGEECTVGLGLCARNGVNRCNPNGDGSVSCSVEPGPAAPAEICDALDNDCDGVTDEGEPRDQAGRGGGDVCDTMRPGRCGPGILTCTDGAVICRPNAGGIAEVCNNFDDDCNEIVDDVPGRGEICSAGVGACRREGQQECDVDVGGLVCNAVAADPIDEVCNGINDDCDGAVDEGNPGGGQACDTMLPGICSAGLTECPGNLAADDPGFGQLRCNPINQPGVEICNGLDDDCDGTVDEVEGRGEVCEVGIGVCQRRGTLECDCSEDANGDIVCSSDQLLCTAVAGEPEAQELCDELDRDCDGAPRNGFALGVACTVGEGECVANGVTVCAGDGSGTICNANAGEEAIEVCDGLDNDCDGLADEGNPDSGGACDTGQAGRCQDGVLNCREVCDANDPDDCTGELVCERVNGPIAEICNGLNDDCDGSTDEDYALGDACQRGQGECEEEGVLRCNAAGDGTECSVSGGLPQPELCDGLDNDCDGNGPNGVDEGFNLGAQCEDGIGRCRQFGIIECNGDGSAGCNAERLEPLENELCNLIDDDCDGPIDEGNPEGGANCPVNNPGVCAFGVMQCSEGEVSCVPNALPGDLDEVCDGLDNDCDGGDPDEGNPGGGAVCQTGDLGACADGTTQCAGGFLLCFGNLAPSPESCDYVDNDCDGPVDEAFPTLGDACDSEDDADLCENGVVDCDLETGGLLCRDDFEVPEICDNRDNDCDGIVDNGFDKLTDVTNCGACGRDCRDPDPQVEGFEYPNAACVGGTCFQTFYVDETNGSNAAGDGSEQSPWRSLNHAMEPGRIDSSDYPARVYVAQGRYATDQWVNAPQCDGNQNGDASDDLCVSHTIACETNGNPQNIERCTECVCDAALVCANGTCSLPESERERFPIRMRDLIQIVGQDDVDHVVIDGGSRACFVNENGGDCNIADRNGDRSTLIEILDMPDLDFREEANTCFELDNPDCMDPNNPNYAFLSVQPNWQGRGSRNLLANLTLLRGARGNDSTLIVGTNANQPTTSIRLQGLKIIKNSARQAFAVAEIDLSYVFFDNVLIEDCEARGAKSLVLAGRSGITVDGSRFQNNDITTTGYGIFRASDATVNVRNSTFSNNVGGGVLFDDGGRGSVFYSTFAGNETYNIVVVSGAYSPVVISNNIFTATDNVQSIFVHRDVERKAMVYSNLFYETSGRGFANGRQVYGNTLQLNATSWADDNITGNPRLANISANNLSLSRVTSAAVDEGKDRPLSVPPPSVINDPVTGEPGCAEDFECINRGARDPKWNLDAFVCQDGLCRVDTSLDEDEDGHRDWLELIFGDVPICQGANRHPGCIGSDMFDLASWPPSYLLRTDGFGGVRPSGDANDIGAFEFTQ